MESRKLVLWGAVVALLAVGMGLVAMTLWRDREPDFTELVQQADEVVVVSPARDIEIKPRGELTAAVDEVYRGSLKVGATVRAFAPERGSPVKLIRGGRYVLLLRKSERGGGYDLLTRQVLTVSADKVRRLLDGEPQSEWTADEFQAFLKSNAPKTAFARRTSLEGRWFLVVTRGNTDSTPALVELSAGSKGRMVASSLPAAVLRSTKIDGDAVEIVVASDGPDLKFSGRRSGAVVLGEFTAGDLSVFPARLEPTDAESLRGRDASHDTEGTPAFIKAVQSGKLPEYESWLTAYPNSPMAFAVWYSMLELLTKQKADEKSLETFGERYIQDAGRWGPFLALQARLNLGMQLMRAELHPDLAMRHLAAVLASPGIRHWKPMAMRAQGGILLRQSKEAEGVALLQQVLKDYPLDVESILALAGYYEAKKDLDKAIEAYADLAVVPGLQRTAADLLAASGKVVRERLPYVVLDRLWREKHGDTTKIEAYLLERYEARVPPIHPEKVPPRKAGEGNRVSLLELYTGTACPPCVAADLAVEALASAYGPGEVVVLQYHQHVPGFDPLANEQAGAKFKEIKGEGTPVIHLNGQPIPGVGGEIDQVPQVYDRLRRELEPVLKEKTGYRVSVTSRMVGTKLSVTAKASGPEKLPPDLWLKVALAEERVDYTGSNGVWIHRMIVRSLPLGQGGREPENGVIDLEGTTDLVTLRDGLSQQIGAMEEGAGIKLPKPFPFKSFVVVAFLTSKTTGEVLQVASVKTAGLKE